ncbi:hypothetical protein CBW55_17815 [Yersinia intermedia]|nr:hypothetical protein CBW55_17815 [Yersinia intermedia]
MAAFNHPNHLQHSKLIGTLSLTAFPQLELFRVYIGQRSSIVELAECFFFDECGNQIHQFLRCWLS